MKQTLLIVLLLDVFLCFSCASSQIKYPAGRDTIQQFGDGFFSTCKKSDKTIGLFCEYEGRIVISNVDVIHKSGNRVYIIGWESDTVKSYGIIDTESNTMQILFLASAYCDSQKINYPAYFFESGFFIIKQELSDFGEKDQEVFFQLERESKK